MAFENDIVWEKVVEAESDLSSRNTSASLRGLPFQHILGVNPSLNYLGKFLFEIDKFYTFVRDNMSYNAITKSIRMPYVEVFVSFGDKLNMFSMKNNHIENATGLFVEVNDYLESQLSSQHVATHGSTIRTIKSALRTTYEGEEPLLSRIGNAASYHNLCLLPTLNFLASGVYMDADTSEEEEHAWLYVFDLFAGLEHINGKLV